VQLLVDMITEDGQTFPQGTVFKAPYMRAQGGANAVILDPEPGDLGICVFASRDISPIKSNPESARNRKPSPGAQPGSKRMFSLSDAMYVGGLLNGAPTQFVQFSAAGIVVKSPTKVTLQAPEIDLIGAVVQTGGDVTMAQALDVQGNITTPAEVTAGNIGLTTHKHPTAPTGPVSAPIP
jgi:hypothetical protein